jgi:hypothetical protein
MIYGCIDKYEMSIPQDAEKLVIEGQIVDKNQGACYSYVRITKPKLGINANVSASWQTEDFTPINDAIVIIRDDLGFIDTFQTAPEYVDYNWVDWDGQVYSGTTANSNYQRGYYQSQKFTAVKNRTYYLTVKYMVKEYHSTCFMPSLPKMDSISFITEATGKDGRGNIPYLYFKDPPEEKNYYLFVGQPGATYWSFNVLDDQFINPDVNGINIFKGITNTYWMGAYIFHQAPYHLEVHSLTREAYDYYFTLSKLFSNDGGNYKPAPASPKSNIDNGALGFFRASSVHIFEGRIP